MFGSKARVSRWYCGPHDWCDRPHLCATTETLCDRADLCATAHVFVRPHGSLFFSHHYFDDDKTLSREESAFMNRTVFSGLNCLYILLCFARRDILVEFVSPPQPVQCLKMGPTWGLASDVNPVTTKHSHSIHPYIRLLSHEVWNVTRGGCSHPILHLLRLVSKGSACCCIRLWIIVVLIASSMWMNLMYKILIIESIFLIQSPSPNSASSSLHEIVLDSEWIWCKGFPSSNVLNHSTSFYGTWEVLESPWHPLFGSPSWRWKGLY